MKRMSESAIPLSLPQRRVISLAWITYAAYYLGRVNISTALPDIQSALGLSKGDVGLITTGFFWAYALGQLINGPLGDRISPRKFIFIGMLFSAGINLLFGSVSVFIWLLLLWTINGYFQATGWGPTLRTLSNWLSPAQRTRVSGVFGSCFVAGNAFTWLLTGWLVSRYGWRVAFWIPGILMVIFAVFWYLLARDHPIKEEGPADQIISDKPIEGFPLARLLPNMKRIWTLVLSSASLGFVLVTLIVWMPTYYVEVAGLEIGLASTVSSFLPFAGIAGTLLIGWLSGRFWIGREAVGLAFVLVLLAVSFVSFPIWSGNIISNVLMMMVIGGSVYGATSLLLTTMALVHGGQDHASSTAGLVDFSFNIGAGLSGGIVGAILNSQPWDVVFIGLAGASLASGVFVILPMIFQKLKTENV